MKKLDKNDPIGPNLTPIDQELELELLHKADDQNVEQEPVFSFNSRRDERQFALYLLYALDRGEYSVDLDDAIKTFERGFDIKIPKKSFALDLARGVIKHRNQLDEQLKPYLKNWRLERLGCCTHLILRLALWELQQEGSISSVVINEAVELAKTFAEKDAYRFVNGILDEVAKALFGDKGTCHSSTGDGNNNSTRGDA